MTNIIRGTVAILLLHYCICNNYLAFNSASFLRWYLLLLQYYKRLSFVNVCIIWS
jgi:hypothetical protein